MRRKIVTFLFLGIIVGCSIIVENRDYKIKTEDGVLFGTLHHKEYEKLVIFISGSGPTDRDGNSDFLEGRSDAVRELAWRLNDKGISTFAYDKRNSGRSRETFDLTDGRFEDLIADGRTVLEEMKSRGYKEIFLVGHSQGALIAEIIGESEDVEAVVSLSGTVQPIDKVLKEQFKQLDAVSYEEAMEILDQIKIGQYDFEVPAALEIYFGGDNTFLHSWMSYSPMEYIPAIEKKLLFIYGDRDSQVSSIETEMLRSDYRYHIVKDMNHVLKKVENDFENKDSYMHPIYEVHQDLVDILVELVLN